MGRGYAGAVENPLWVNRPGTEVPCFFVYGLEDPTLDLDPAGIFSSPFRLSFSSAIHKSLSPDHKGKDKGVKA